MEYEPQLATLVKSAPTGDGWLHEMKYDGYRIIAVVNGAAIRLLSRRGNDWTEQFPEVAEALRQLDVNAVFDGEVAALDRHGKTSFQLLQNAFSRARRPSLAYFVFDLLEFDGEDLRSWPLVDRKAFLEDVLAGSESATLVYATHVVGGGEAVFKAACTAGLEGIVSKQAEARYTPGRKPTWVKVKCIRRQEFIVCGVYDRTNSGGQEVGALALGFYDGGQLVYAGKVGTGFGKGNGRELREELRAIEQDECPYPSRPAELRYDIHWLRPERVCEITFAEMTDGGRVRHPSFLGMRRDKKAKDVVRERAAAPPAEAVTPMRSDAPVGIHITHGERVLYPHVPLTKLGLANYYEAIAQWMVPHVVGRPLTLLRCEKDIGHCEFMRHGKAWGPSELRRVRIQEKTKVGEYLVADTPAALVALVQMDVVEVHTWNSDAADVDRPSRIVFDLDPGPRVPWSEVIEAARLVRSVLSALQLESWVKTTGGVGLHIVMPLDPVDDWRACFEFSRIVCEAVERQHPKRYTTAMPKAGRERKILLDYFRNNRTNTSVAAFSTRAKPTASVSAPIAWDELNAKMKSNHFTVETIVERMKTTPDPWQGYWETKQRIDARATAALQQVGR